MARAKSPSRTKQLNQHIGKAIKKARQSRTDYHQVDLAAAVNLQRSYISELESGKRNPTIETLAVICEELGVSLSNVIAEAEAEYKVQKKK